MQGNTLRMAIRATTSALVVGVAGQASALELSAGDYSAELYGYARFNAVYDVDEDISISTRAGSFELLGGADEDITGHFSADAVQSRLGVRTTTPEGVKIVIEGDFRPGTIRLRHGYGEYKGVLLGQNWSNFNSFVGNTTTLDFDGLAGLAGFQSRLAQARYTNGPLSFSIEEPTTSVFGIDAKQSLPAFTARFEDSNDGLSYSAAVLAHEVSADDGSDDDSIFGFATFGAAKMAVTDTLSIQGTVTYTQGANSYLYLSGGDDAYVDGNSLESIPGYGGSIGFGLDLSGGRSVNVGYGITTIDWDDAEDDGVAVGGEHETNQNLMANYIWTPVKDVMLGVEYAFFKTEFVNGDDADANRIMFSGQYNF